MLLIKNGRVVDPVNGVDKVMDVLVDGGQIVMTGDKAVDMFDEAKASAGIGEAGNIVCGSDVNYEENAFNVIDAAGLVVAPGLVDTHVHFRDPGLTYKEDIFTGAAAAAKGGFTTVVCMANTKPTVDNVDTLAYVLEKGAQTGIHVLSASAPGILPSGHRSNFSEARHSDAAANAERAINNFFIFFFRQNCCVLAILRTNLSILIRGRPYYSSRSRVRLYRTYAGLRELYSF